MINYKTQLEELKKGCNACQTLRKLNSVKNCPTCQTKISLLSQIIYDLKKEWNELKIDHNECVEGQYYVIGKREFIEQITGYTVEQLSLSDEDYRVRKMCNLCGGTGKIGQIGHDGCYLICDCKAGKGLRMNQDEVNELFDYELNKLRVKYPDFKINRKRLAGEKE